MNIKRIGWIATAWMMWAAFGASWALGPTPALAQTGHDLFQQALVKEQADGDLRAAIALYERIVQEFGENRSLAAHALVQVGKCYERLGSQEAQRAYRRVVSDYSDQSEHVEEARSRLAALIQPPPADGRTLGTRRIASSREGNANSGDWFGGPHPDGRHFVYIDWSTGSLAIRDLFTGEVRDVIRQRSYERGTPISAKVSPDGDLVAYCWNPADDPDWDYDTESMLRLVGIDGSGDRLLLVVGDIGTGSWSWDGRHIAAHRFDPQTKDMEIVWISTEDGTITLLWRPRPEQEPPSVFSHSPDNQFLAVEFPLEEGSTRHDIMLLSTQGGEPRPLVTGPADDQLIGWVPGTDVVLFTSDREGQPDLWAVRISEEGIPDIPFTLMRGVGDMDPLGFATDGTLFLMAGVSQYIKEIAPFDETSGRVFLERAEPLLGNHDNSGFAWSPTGDSLVLAYGEEGGGYSVRLKDLNGGAERVLTREVNPATVGGLHWSPDGRSILTVGMEVDVPRDEWSTTPAGLFRIDVESGDVRRLSDFSPDQYWWMEIGMVPTPDGQGVIYGHQGKLVYRDLESGADDVIFSHPNLTGPMKFSPDGSELLFGLAESGQGGRATGDRRLMVLPFPEGEPRELMEISLEGLVGSFNWTLDGQHILFLLREEEGTAVMRIPRSGGDPERLWETDRSLPGFTLSPDHRTVGLQDRAGEYEIWVMENLVEALGSSRSRGSGR
ncbi:MAG: tetratricopeptide repeat protein [Gemmatimonadota bacterium]|jgi:dipeptidyl aminopeptidase/acylaminoacyl peptidase